MNSKKNCIRIHTRTAIHISSRYSIVVFISHPLILQSISSNQYTMSESRSKHHRDTHTIYIPKATRHSNRIMQAGPFIHLFIQPFPLTSLSVHQYLSFHPSMHPSIIPQYYSQPHKTTQTNRPTGNRPNQQGKKTTLSQTSNLKSQISDLKSQISVSSQIKSRKREEIKSMLPFPILSYPSIHRSIHKPFIHSQKIPLSFFLSSSLSHFLNFP